jgi:hypothetical protein
LKNVNEIINTNGSVNKENMIKIEKNVITKLVHPKILPYFENFNFDINMLTNFVEKNVLKSNHDFIIGNKTLLKITFEKFHASWRNCFVALNLLRNLKIPKYVELLDKLIASKKELYENIDLIIEDHKEATIAKQFYQDQLTIIH